MHQYGLVEDLLLRIDENVHANEGRRAVRVLLSVSGMPPAEESHIQSTFDTLKIGSTASEAELAFEYVPFEASCLDCGTNSLIADGADACCPECGSHATRPAHGEVIFLKSVEIEV